jgi:hypothetical protein
VSEVELYSLVKDDFLAVMQTSLTFKERLLAVLFERQ